MSGTITQADLEQSTRDLSASMDNLFATASKIKEQRDDLLHAAKRALNVFKAQGESIRPNNVLAALDAAIRKAEGGQS